MNAKPLSAAKIMYIFQLMLRRSGGTANARPQFQAQFDAVDSETALARTLFGKTSAGSVHETGPQDMAKVATNRYEHETTALAWVSLLTMIQVTAEVGSVWRWPKAPWIDPEINSQVIIPREPRRRVGLRPHLSIQMIAGTVMRTLMMYWIEAVRSGFLTSALSITYTI